MSSQQTAFGIDFGTTNTRVAYYDGERLRMIPFIVKGTQSFQVPSLISYRDGTMAGFGALARSKGTVIEKPKWLLGKDEPVEIDGGERTAVEIVADFFRELRRLVGETGKTQPMERAALTIPVHYPPKARRQLQDACRLAGIEVTHFFFEPSAAIYCSLVAAPVSGVTAVFDWGGGSLDIATVQIRNGVALTRQIDGWHRGGADFDRMICEQALNEFLLAHPQPPLTADIILDRMKVGQNLPSLAEEVKVRLSKQDRASLGYSAFLRGKNLDYSITRADFEQLISYDVTSATTRLEHALHTSGVSPKLLARLFLSGGTCNIPKVHESLAAQVAGHRIVHRLRLPSHVKAPTGGGLDDISNATALGAALLAVHGAKPVFASSLGVRLADASGDQFYPVFKAGETLNYQPRRVSFFVTDSTSGVARLLVCDQDDAVQQPHGRLLRVIPVPIDHQENWLDVTFTLDPYLVLRVEGTGRKQTHSGGDSIQHLNFGFSIPDFVVSEAAIPDTTFSPIGG